MLDIDQLEDLMDELRVRITIANREGTLNQLLKALGMHDLLEPQITSGNKKGKIVILGESKVDEEHLLGTAKKLGLDKSRFEFCLEYDKMQKYNFRKLQNTDIYRVILVGPMPHSTRDKGECGSIISKMESRPDIYPRVIRMDASGQLKITKNCFAEVIGQLINDDYI